MHVAKAGGSKDGCCLNNELVPADVDNRTLARRLVAAAGLTLVALLAAPVAVCVSSEESGGGGRGRRHIDGSAATVPLGQRGGGTRVRSRSTPLFNNMCRSHDLMAFVPSKLHTCSAPALACAHAKLDSAHAFSHFTAVRSRLLSAPA